ncbi:hypothetical protein [Chondromyces apiculatus]|uniref:hypothetical protein n=1 Tax=Chondromyces apiculatus TaxID=51 RepID=UPI0012DFE310|nr:hypothetical protein [Chondromyces apiculatus]
MRDLTRCVSTWRMLVLCVPASPVLALRVFASPVFASPVFASPVFALRVFDPVPSRLGRGRLRITPRPQDVLTRFAERLSGSRHARADDPLQVALHGHGQLPRRAAASPRLAVTRLERGQTG